MSHALAPPPLAIAVLDAFQARGREGENRTGVVRAMATLTRPAGLARADGSLSSR